MQAAAKTILEWRKNPCLFVEQVFGAKPTPQQQELLRAVPHQRRMAVKSGHGTGKDACASWIILWFLLTRPHSRGVATAPIFRQLNDVLWGEVAKWIRKSPLRDEFVVEKDLIYVAGHKRTWFFRGATASVKASPEEQAETLAGYHEDHFLVVVDEASGVPDPVFKPLEGILTRPDNKVLLIGNPTKDSGYFYDVFHHDKDRWFTLTWNSEESPNVDASYIEFYRNKYGVDSDPYRVRVLGEFPRQSADTLISRSKIIECQQYWYQFDKDEIRQEPLVVGLDVARSGPDRTVMTLRYGLWVDEQLYTYEKDTMVMCEWVMDNLAGRDESVIYVDAVGLGGPVADRLRQLGKNVVDVNVGWRSSDPQQWRRLRDELWWQLRERIANRQIALPPSEDLVDELSSVKAKWAGNQLVVADKATMRKELGFSPDLADSLVLTEYDCGGTLISAWHNRKKRYRRAHLSWRVI